MAAVRAKPQLPARLSMFAATRLVAAVLPAVIAVADPDVAPEQLAACGVDPLQEVSFMQQRKYWARMGNSSRRARSLQEPRKDPITPFELWDMYGIGGPSGEEDGGRPATRSAVALREEARRAQHARTADVGSRAPQHSSSAASLCVGGKLVPEFYLLGYPKCGTTTLADDLRDVGVRSNVEPEKEAHFFEFRFLAEMDYSEISSAWFEASENCTSPEPKRVIGDYTPDNMRLVPPPDDWAVENLPDIGDLSRPDAGRFNLPLLFTSYLYTGASSRLTFAVMVRETLARFQSSWYFYHFDLDGHNHTWLSANGTFSKFVSNSIARAEGSHDYVFRLWGGLYGRHLQAWLEYFHPSQFYFIPFLHYMRPGGKAIVFGELEGRLGVPLPATEREAASHSNSNSHPSLDEDLSPELQARFRAFIAPEVNLLVDTLAACSTQGMGLANFSGTLGSAADVRTWLEAGW